jgi:mannose/cellobiose epimerase-like protein (N-acyl-D-glucosamine 2-epimerase family)
MSRIRRLPRASLVLARRLAEDAHGAMSVAWRAAVGRGLRRDERLPDAARLDAIHRQTDAALADKVMPFWASHAWDEQHDGFITHLDRAGQWLGPTDKYLVPQARLVWTLAAAHRHGLVGKGYLELAGRGARFLVERMWDPQAGGFVWGVRRDGTPLVPDKRTYGQAFAIYGLSEYALAAGSQWARDWAVRGLDVLVERGGDGDLGFFEWFDGGWTPVPGPAGSGKTVNVHLHVMEALTTLLEATADPRHAAQLRSVLNLVLSRGVDARHHYAIDDHLDREWRRTTSWRRPVVVNYGQGAELAWLARHAVDVLGDPPERIRESLLALVDHAMDYGFDHRRGGLAQIGPPVGEARLAWYLPAERLVKRWWEQAEMLVATLFAYQWTGQPRYLVAFERQFDWMWTRQIDPESGDWCGTTASRVGRPLSFVSHDRNEPYHGARALMEVSRRLSAVRGGRLH